MQTRVSDQIRIRIKRYHTHSSFGLLWFRFQQPCCHFFCVNKQTRLLTLFSKFLFYFSLILAFAFQCMQLGFCLVSETVFWPLLLDSSTMTKASVTRALGSWPHMCTLIWGSLVFTKSYVVMTTEIKIKKSTTSWNSEPGTTAISLNNNIWGILCYFCVLYHTFAVFYFL